MAVWTAPQACDVLSRRLGTRVFHQPETDGPTSVEDIYVSSHAESASAEEPPVLTRRFTTHDVHTIGIVHRADKKGPAEPMLRRRGPDLE